jgi:hypothetical protein
VAALERVAREPLEDSYSSARSMWPLRREALESRQGAVRR